jgi:hypothetical protein
MSREIFGYFEVFHWSKAVILLCIGSLRRSSGWRGGCASPMTFRGCELVDVANWGRTSKTDTMNRAPTISLTTTRKAAAQELAGGFGGDGTGGGA